MAVKKDISSTRQNSEGNDAMNEANSKSIDYPKIIVIGLVLLFILYSLVKMLIGSDWLKTNSKQNSAANTEQIIQNEPVSKARPGITGVITTGSAEAANKVLPEKMELQSCGYGECKSFVRVADKQSQEPKRGLNIYVVKQDNSIALLRTLDHCAETNIFTEKPTLSEFLKANKTAKAFIMLGDDTVNCGFETGLIQGLSEWTAGYKAEALDKLGPRNNYIAVIDAKSNSIIYEVGSNDIILVSTP